jgi:hypothetical protein
VACKILITVLCHELKELGMSVILYGKSWKGACSGYPMHRIVCQKKLPHLLITLLSRSSLWGRTVSDDAGGKSVSDTSTSAGVKSTVIHTSVNIFEASKRDNL